jgi:transcriptional regulator with XRE-family HTH domain
MEKVRIMKIIKVDLKGLRKKAGLSTRELGKLSGISFAHINKIENGLIMTEKTWDKINRVLYEKSINI